MGIILKNAMYIDWKTLEFSNTDIKIEKDNNKLSFNKNIAPLQGDQLIDCSGKYVTKALACGHHHVYSALSRGMGAPKKSPENFHEILKYIWWTLDKSLTKEMTEASALYTALASAKNGVSFVVDHHASPNFINSSLDTIAKAFEKVGVSHLLCYEITDRDGIDKANMGLEETESYLENKQGLVGLHASFTVGDQSMKKAVNLAEKYKSGLHIHVAEDTYDQEHSLKHYNKRVVERLHNFGVLNFSKSILGHCLHLSEKEKELISSGKAWVVQNTESNLNNRVGFFNADGLSDRILLGTDGMHSDMLRSTKAAFFVGQNFDNIDYAKAYQRLRNIHKYLAENKFTGDEDNNLVVFNYDSPTEFNKDNFLGHLIFGLEGRHTEYLISSGELIISEGKPTKVNEQEILDFSKEMGNQLWHKMQQI
ncbi:MAG: amidohydrolase [Marinilabiliales bacterium]|nr:MAG: amidohydrolase [Marinilabiliales bacterium]